MHFMQSAIATRRLLVNLVTSGGRFKTHTDGECLANVTDRRVEVTETHHSWDFFPP